MACTDGDLATRGAPGSHLWPGDPADLGEPSRLGDLSVRVGPNPNRRWSDSDRGYAISARRAPLIGPGSKVFTIGSCFAAGIRVGLERNGYTVLPDYGSMSVDPSRQQAGSQYGMITYYDTFTIRQEFERAFGEADPSPRHIAADPDWRMAGSEVVPQWLDPGRHYVFAADEEAIVDLMASLDACFRRAVEEADVYVITLGLIEAWVDEVTGQHAWGVKVPRTCAEPDRFRFHLSDYPENLDNVAYVVDGIHDRYPDRQIVLTVSPVSLAQTFSDQDIVVANTYSKSVLRAVAGAVASTRDHVTYWPSYEIAQRTDVYQEDGRHVTVEATEFIVSRFLEAHASSS